MLERPTKVAALVKQVGKDAPLLARLENAALRSSGRSVDLVELAADPTAWVGGCGEIHFVEPLPEVEATDAPQQLAPLDQTFGLESRPSAGRVIYLDFNGQTVTNSYWNTNPKYGATIVAAPFSLDATVSTDFSELELRHIQNVWAAVAEDYAPFDVNVTTKDPGTAGIKRSTLADTQYGSRVVMTQGGPIAGACGCAGVAMLGTFDRVDDSEYMQPAWVFGSGHDTYDALTASHEVGHNFNLRHHGTSSSGYYAGAEAWIPLMGGGALRRVSQWSDGSYPDANNATQDDLALIAAKAPYILDDHPGAVGGTNLAVGTSVAGRIARRTDVDRFSFTASGATTVSVTHTSWLPNLDVGLTILDALGATVATVDPMVSSDGRTGLSATWSGTLPPGSYVAVVDGVGTGDPKTAGRYSDYASVGSYAIGLTASLTPPTTQPPTVDPTSTTEPTTTEPTSPTPTPTVAPTPSPTTSATTAPFVGEVQVGSRPSRMAAPRAKVRRTRLVLTWLPATSNGSAVKGYVIDFKRGRDRVVGVVKKSVFKHMLRGRHRVRVAARSEAGTSAYSKWVVVRIR